MNARVAELRSHLKVDAYDALIDIGKEWLQEMKDDVVPYLDHEDEQLREAAIRVVGFYWNLPEFRDKAWQMFLTETDVDVRSVALMSWAQYFSDTKNPEVLRRLGAVFSDGDEDNGVCGMAYMCAQSVDGVSGRQLRDVDEDPDGLIDWQWAESVCGVTRR